MAVYDVKFVGGGVEQLQDGEKHKVGDLLHTLDDPFNHKRWEITEIDHSAKTCRAKPSKRKS